MLSISSLSARKVRLPLVPHSTMAGCLPPSVQLPLLVLVAYFLTTAVVIQAVGPPRYQLHLEALRAPSPFLPRRAEDVLHWVEGTSEKPGEGVQVELGKDSVCQTLALATLPPLDEVKEWAEQDRRLGLSFLPISSSDNAYLSSLDNPIESRQILEALVSRGTPGELATRWGWPMFSLDPWVR